MPHLVSIIIPCYNNGNYLKKAIESVLSQSYQHIEIVVVDDGSIDHTKEVTEEYPTVKYVYQSNYGVSVARNTGIKNSAGNLLIFLDADDWLLPEAIAINIKYLTQNPEAAFVCGGYEFFHQPTNKTWLIRNEVTENHYCHLLKNNFIGMQATILFQRWVFDLFRYDINLKGCEDYDLYLKIVRKHKIFIHTELIATYYIHRNNVSSNYLYMLESALLVLKRQKKLLANETEEKWFRKGIIYWKSFYSKKIYDRIIHQLYDVNQTVSKAEDIDALKKYNRYLFIKYMYYTKIKSKMKALLIRIGFYKITLD